MDNNKLINEIIKEVKASQDNLVPSAELKDRLMMQFKAKHQSQKRMVSFRCYAAIAASIFICISLAYFFSTKTKDIENQIVTNSLNTTYSDYVMEPKKNYEVIKKPLTKKKRREVKINPINANLKDIEKTLLGQSSNLIWQEEDDQNNNLPLSSDHLPICEED